MFPSSTLSLWEGGRQCVWRCGCTVCARATVGGHVLLATSWLINPPGSGNSLPWQHDVTIRMYIPPGSGNALPWQHDVTLTHVPPARMCKMDTN